MTEKINRLQTIFPNASGFLAILLWATGACSVCFLDALPPFQLLTIVFFLVFAFTIGKLTLTKGWKRLKMTWKHWLLIMMGLPLQQLLYVYAYKNCPPEEVDILIYTWPLISLFFLYTFYNKRLTPYQIMGAILGFLAVVVISLKSTSQDFHFGTGHLSALLTALSWGLFTVLSKKGPKITSDNIGISYGVGFFIVLGLHLHLETPQIPAMLDSLGVLYYAFCIATAPFILWTYSTQRGNLVLLSTAAYFKPLLSIILLILAGFAQYSLNISIAGFLILTAGLLSSNAFTDWLHIKIGKHVLSAFPKAIVSQKP